MPLAFASAPASRTARRRPRPAARPSSREDADLVSAIAAGDSEALAELHRRHAAHLRAIAERITGDAADAEEVVQEAFLYAWRRARHYQRSRSAVSTWLVLIGRSRAVDRLRRRQRLAAVTASADREPSPPEPAGSGPDGYDRVLGRERARRLRGAVDRLCPAQRQIVDLCYRRGLSQSEAAAALGIPLGTVKTRAFLALRHLRGELAPEAAALR